MTAPAARPRLASARCHRTTIHLPIDDAAGKATLRVATVRRDPIQAKSAVAKRRHHVD
jgi:hypothetical protein